MPAAGCPKVLQRSTQSRAFGLPCHHIVEVIFEEDEVALAGEHNNQLNHRGGIGFLSQLCQAEPGREYLLAIAEWCGRVGGWV